MRLSSQLTKLEQRAKVALRCDWCRYILRDTLPSQQKQMSADPQSFATSTCRFCGTKALVSLAGTEPYERDLLVALYSQKWGSTFRDEKFYASQKWLHQWRGAKAWAAGKVPDDDRRQANVRREVNKDRVVREREEIEKRAFAFLRRMHKREEKEFAPHSFPLHAEIEAIEKPDFHGFVLGTHRQMMPKEKQARDILYCIQIMEACERALWGKLQPRTKAWHVKAESVIQECEAERARREREAEEEKRRREDEKQRQIEDYERERAARSQPAQVMPEVFSIEPKQDAGISESVPAFMREPDIFSQPAQQAGIGYEAEADLLLAQREETIRVGEVRLRKSPSVRPEMKSLK